MAETEHFVHVKYMDNICRRKIVIQCVDAMEEYDAPS